MVMVSTQKKNFINHNFIFKVKLLIKEKRYLYIAIYNIQRTVKPRSQVGPRNPGYAGGLGKAII